MLWEDQVDYAQTLRVKRQTYSTALVVVAGLGLFKLEWFRHRDSVPTLGVAGQWVVVGLLVVALIAFFFGAYALFTERAILRPRLARMIGLGDAAKGWLPRFGWSVEGEDSLVKRDSLSERAIAALTLSAEEQELVTDASPEDGWRVRTQRLRLAYERLTLANRRVGQRINLGLLFIFVRYFVVALTIISYGFMVARSTGNG